MSTQANSEQLRAIQHKGGVLLSAGAGSGKTFVLKEHFIYLCESWIDDFSKKDSMELNQFIKKKLRKLVFMTFTNKAAGELEIRIKMAIDSKLEICSENHQAFWQSIRTNVDFMTIGTIHGFCLRLIRQGFLRSVPSEISIISDNEFIKYLSDQLDNWLLAEKDNFGSEQKMMLKNKDKVVDALWTIFSDASVRKSWLEATSEHIFSDDYINHILEQICLELGFKDVWNPSINILETQEHKGKKWQIFLDEFLKYIQSGPNILQVISFFDGHDFKIPARPSGKNIAKNITLYYESVRDLKDWLKKNSESILAFIRFKNSSVKSWYESLVKLVLFVENNYSQMEGVTFADLEYLVITALKDESIIEEISKEYHYFVVDEFQDTSQLQFSIIEKIIKGDYTRLFCVGDPKQAIYGFRGGELGVFLDCMKKMPLKLSLRNNYRSLEEVIDYNNHFFEFLFKKGIGFEGEEINSIRVEHQESPISYSDKGRVQELNLSLDFLEEGAKISNFEIDYLEALGIFEQINSLKTRSESCAVLYKRLKPSYILIDQLIKNNISFTAQVKIPFLEDPINGIFDLLLKYLKNKSERKDEYSLYLLNAYGRLIKGENYCPITTNILKKFVTESEYYGIYYGFCHVLESLSVSNSNYVQNLQVIEAAIKASHHDIDELIIYFDKLKGNSYSVDFQYGDKPESVLLMSAHASKGLQFPHVILGGIHTNGTTIVNRGPIGKLPGSFKWSDKLEGRKQYKTPVFLWEEIVNKKREFSESKRLFYVANTRAEQSLSYITLSFNAGKRSRIQSDSWVNGIETWKEQGESFTQLERIQLRPVEQDKFSKLDQNQTPFFHRDNLGIIMTDEKKNSLLIPELSVTRLASLSQCPRKFYLENFCRLSDEDTTILASLGPCQKEENNPLLEETLPSLSSKERGDRLHLEISRAIKCRFQVDVSTDIAWVVEELKTKQKDFNFVSEKQMTFPFFSYMINGIPDLILFSRNPELPTEVWDFKTGRYDKKKDIFYQFQLYCYAYALYSQKYIQKEETIGLFLYYVDEKKKTKELISFQEVEAFLSRFLADINSPEIENEEHCPSCSFRPICQK